MGTQSPSRFEGFPKDLPDFLWGLAFHNEKPWFEAHRADYERCLHGPVKALVGQIMESLLEQFPDLVLTPHISRIYRDARMLNGRGPLNDHMWFSLGRTGKVHAAEPQFYFGVEARCCDWGVGYWSISASGMEKWRRMMDTDPQRMSRIARTVKRMDGFELLGESYKRPKGDPGPLLYDWYNIRRPVIGKVEWFEPDPPGAELAERVTADFARLMPLYEYLALLND